RGLHRDPHAAVLLVDVEGRRLARGPAGDEPVAALLEDLLAEPRVRRLVELAAGKGRGERHERAFPLLPVGDHAPILGGAPCLSTEHPSGRRSPSPARQPWTPDPPSACATSLPRGSPSKSTPAQPSSGASGSSGVSGPSGATPSSSPSRACSASGPSP